MAMEAMARNAQSCGVPRPPWSRTPSSSPVGWAPPTGPLAASENRWAVPTLRDFLQYRRDEADAAARARKRRREKRRAESKTRLPAG